ncbi:uncharacterized protein LOC114877334 [Osmia bicornis bicornis]|uniref:uncharacterized protein LOC114877334 n=1 Tax=Osmia bicornis bicornis TaxID=1437191 RepID=UPI0010F94D13|nr:uncharacterized protein LOC114877334 [Osmia bicornis bicornis]XP_029045609.1 uncharacterized protein LOC114877334 [Osmia bicornis bicornis]XP_029045610.1 uncharacterized protein LOC114877334 [Osmia bicornis bicornis]
MNTPTTRDFLRRPNGTRRRSVRQALAVIPVNNTELSPGEAISTEVNAMDNFLNSRQGSDSWSPAPSPDELVIQKRGRRCRPIVWSPDLDTCKRNSLFSLSSKDRTPVKSPSKSTMVLRSTPRKRLILGDTNESEFTTPEKKKKSQSSLDSNSGQRHYTGNLLNGLRGLSHEQLVQMIMDLVSMQEDGILHEGEKISNLLLKKMPVADIQPLIDTLNNLKQNIRISMMSSNLDDLASSHAYIHLDAYQKIIIDQGKRLVESQHWMSVMHYVYAAWNITKQMKDWENKNLCNFMKKCFKNLTHFCIQALKKGNFTNSVLDMFSDRLAAMVNDYDDIITCVELINEAKQN